MATNYKGVISDPTILNTAWSRIEPRLEKKSNGCWLLNDTKSTVEDYYPQISVNGYMEAAHRISYRFHKGELPEGMLVRHTCHTPRCCNPAHLIQGTIADNMQDKVDAGRTHRFIGEDAPKAKLTNIQTMEIYVSNETTEALADKYSVDPSTITRIRTAKHTLTKYLPVRKFNDAAHFTEDRKQKISEAAAIKREMGIKRKSPSDTSKLGKKGAAHPMAKLTSQDYANIHASANDNNELAARYNVSNRTIRNIKAGRHGATK